LITILVIRRQREGDPPRWRDAAIWTGAFLAAAAPWLAVNWAHTGNPLTNNNYTNVGFAVYGEGNWERFFYGSDRKIHSFADVVLLDPGRFAGVMVANTIDHLKRDLSQLMPVFWGVLAVAGALVVGLERRGRLWTAFLFFGALYFLTLVPVFYGARFSLAMLPYYIALAIVPFTWRPLSERAAAIERQFPVRIFVFLLLWLPGAYSAYMWTEDVRNAESVPAGPYETMEAAAYLKQHANGGALLARKPHVAFVAGLRFVPIPEVDSPAALHDVATRERASYLLVSGAEMALRAAVRPFAERGAQIPGFRRVFESQGALVYEVVPVTPGAARGPGAADRSGTPASAPLDSAASNATP
jgi:hypothetical protein